MTEARAPGKLVICGEYAVLAGAPAIAVAMPVQAEARVTTGVAESELRVAGGGSWRFAWQEGVPRWREVPPGGEGRILESVAATLAADGWRPAGAIEVSLDTRAFTHAGRNGIRKLGLGSSAALTVALTAALLAPGGGRAARGEALLDVCLRAHRSFQDGAGSGIDIAAAVYGGVVALAGVGGAVHRLAWPQGLDWLAVWSGESASTRELLGHYRDFERADPVLFRRHIDALRVRAAAVLGAWRQAAAGEILRTLADYDAALRALDASARIGIYTPEHERLAREAAAAGAVYKISGAGGGDFGVAFAAAPGAIESLAARFTAAGLTVIRAAADMPGVTVR
jgi:phosphomevalonate kinase